MMDFVYYRHGTPVGVRVEEVSGGADMSARVAEAMARQIWCENGKNGYRALDHFESGAPFVENSEERISVTHCRGMFAVASLPRTPEADLAVFNLRTAMGIDAEPWERAQVLKVRERFLSPEELALVPADSQRDNILAWTIKEAALKATMCRELDIRADIRIQRLPQVAEDNAASSPVLGAVEVSLEGFGVVELSVYSWTSEGCCLTVAYSPKCATFKKA